MPLKTDRRQTVSAQTFTRTIHMVDVDLTDLLSGFGIEDEVVLMVQTPSGRAKRVAIPANLLVAPHHTEERWS
jgi:hypothetical protein